MRIAMVVLYLFPAVAPAQYPGCSSGGSGILNCTSGYQVNGSALSTGNLFDWTDAGIANGSVPVWNSGSGQWTPSNALLTSDLLLNLSFGQNSFTASTTGYQNTAYGSSSLQSNTSGYLNACFGVTACQDNTSGSNNSAFGANSLVQNTTGYQDTAIGSQALQFNQTGNYNTATGVEALWQLTDGGSNTTVGTSAMTHLVKGSYNTSFGTNALDWIAGGSYNTAVGLNSLYGSYAIITYYSYSAPNLTLTLCAPQSWPTCPGSPPTFSIGDDIGFNVQSGNLRALNGWSGTVTSVASNQITIPTSLVIGSGSVTYSGTEPPELTWTPSDNTAIGAGAMQNAGNGGTNWAGGWQALFNNGPGSLNAGTGPHVLYQNMSGSQNVADGGYALNNLVTGSNNTAVGFRAGAPDDVSNYETGNYNTYVGWEAGPSGNSGLYNAICIGKSCTVTAGNTAVVGNNEITDVYFGSTSPSATIHTPIVRLNNSSLPYSHYSLSGGSTNATSAQVTFGDGVNGDGYKMVINAGASKTPLVMDDTGNSYIGGGTNIVYRCTTAGTLPVGTLTINAANCGGSADTGLRVK